MKVLPVTNKHNVGGGGGGGGGGGFFLACKDLGRMFDNSFPTCAFFVLFLSGD